MWWSKYYEIFERLSVILRGLARCKTYLTFPNHLRKPNKKQPNPTVSFCLLKCTWITFQKVKTDYSKVRVIFSKCRRENLSICNLMLVEERWKHIAQQIFPVHTTIYFSQLLKTNLFNWYYHFLGSTNNCLSKFSKINSRIKWKTEVRDVILLPLLLIFNIFDALF